MTIIFTFQHQVYAAEYRVIPPYNSKAFQSDITQVYQQKEIINASLFERFSKISGNFMGKPLFFFH